MSKNTTVQKKSIVLACLAGFFCTVSLFLIGWTAPVFVGMYRDLGVDPLPANIRIISHIHWFWTMPIGCLIAGIMIWGSERWWSQKASVAVNMTVMSVAVLVLMLFAFTSVLSVFDIQ